MTLFFVGISLILAPKIDPKIDKNGIKKLTKTRYEKRTEKERKKSPTRPRPTSKPDLAGERKAPFEADGLILGAAKES